MDGRLHPRLRIALLIAFAVIVAITPVPAAADIPPVAPTTSTDVAPVTVTPVTVTPVTVTPATVTPATVAPATVTPVTVAPVTVTPVTVTPVTVAPVTVTPVTIVSSFTPEFRDRTVVGGTQHLTVVASAEGSGGVVVPLGPAPCACDIATVDATEGTVSGSAWDVGDLGPNAAASVIVVWTRPG